MNNDGLNITGYLKGDFGTGHAARLMLSAALSTGLPVSAIDSPIPIQNSKKDTTFEQYFTTTFDRKITLWCYNADMIPVASKYYSEEDWNEHYNIALWFWEAPHFPDEWMSSFSFLDEIWVASKFIYEAVKEKSPIPVTLIPLPTEINMQMLQYTRAHFALPSNKFLFLLIYDICSISERKNPYAAIDAFLSAFPVDDTVGLVIKVNHANQDIDEFNKLKDLTARHSNSITLLDTTLRQAEVYSLVQCCDAIISLHRSEGFGLVLTEAMCLGKPVIATNWSGNIDFMNADNSCPVNYKLVNLDRDYGPYKEGQYWAEPDLQHAIYYMRRLVNEPNYYARISKNARHTIAENYSNRKIGGMIKDRIKQIHKT